MLKKIRKKVARNLLHFLLCVWGANNNHHLRFLCVFVCVYFFLSLSLSATKRYRVITKITREFKLSVGIESKRIKEKNSNVKVVWVAILNKGSIENH